jgi:hypothetical protein
MHKCTLQAETGDRQTQFKIQIGPISHETSCYILYNMKSKHVDFEEILIKLPQHIRWGSQIWLLFQTRRSCQNSKIPIDGQKATELSNLFQNYEIRQITMVSLQA